MKKIMEKIFGKLTDWVSGWPLDKVLHFVAGYMLMSIGLAASMGSVIRDGFAKWVTIWTFFVALVAMGKEVIDMLRAGDKSGFDFKDAVWTLIGGWMCGLLMWLGSLACLE